MVQPRARGSIKQVATELQKYKRILITGHINPDGDAIGSSVALSRLLAAHGYEPTVALSPIGIGPSKFLFDSIQHAAVAPTNVKARDYDCAFVLDCSGIDRLPEGPLRDAVKQLPILNIDHHATHTAFSNARWVVPSASSTGELIYRFAKQLGWTIDKEAAQALWVSLITDTGRFAYSCTSPMTLRVAAALLACGIDSSAINDRIFLYASEGAMMLKRKAYDSLQTWMRGKVSVITLTASDFRRAAVAKSEIEDVIDIPRSIPTAIVSIFFYETKEKPGLTRLSIRSRTDNPLCNAATIAQHFGGGGHLRAAGCTLTGKPKTVIPQVKEYLATLDLLNN